MGSDPVYSWTGQEGLTPVGGLLAGDDAGAAGAALVLAADDVGAAGAGGEHRLGQQVGGRVAHVRAGRDLLPDLEVDRAARVAHAHDRARRPDEVAAVQRR